MVHDDSHGLPKATPYYKWALTQYVDSSRGRGIFGEVYSTPPQISNVMEELSYLNVPDDLMICCHGTPQHLAMRIWGCGTRGIGLVEAEEMAADSPRRHVLGISELDYADLMYYRDFVRKLKLRSVAIRACRVGGNPRMMHALRKFFGARFLSAPLVRTAYFELDPEIAHVPGDWTRFAKQHPNAQRYRYGNSITGYNLAIDIQIRNHKVHTRCMVDKREAIREFILERFHDEPQVINGAIAIHALLWGDKLVYPKEDDYKGLIATFC